MLSEPLLPQTSRKKCQGGKKWTVISVMYAALAVEPLYAYFFYQSARIGSDDLFERYNTTLTDWEDNSITVLLAVGTVCQGLQQWITTNPAEATTTFLKREPPYTSRHLNSLPSCTQTIITYPLHWLTLAIGYSAFGIGGLAGSIPLASLIVDTGWRWFTTTLLTGLSLVFYYLLSHQDLVEHNRWIFSWLLDGARSIFLCAIKAPLLSLEVFLEIGANMLYRAFSAAYIMQDFLQVNGLLPTNHTGNHTDYHNSNSTTATPTPNLSLGDAGPAMITAFVLTAWTTLFTRLEGSHNHFFMPTANKLSLRRLRRYFAANPVVKVRPGPIIRDVALSCMRNAGVIIFAYTHLLPNTALAAGIVAGAAVLSLLHAIYVHWLREATVKYLYHTGRGDCIPRVHSQDNTSCFGSLFLAFINLGTRLVRWLAFLGFLLTLNDLANDNQFTTGLNTTDVLLLALSIGTPIGINDYRYYHRKLHDNWRLYGKKSRSCSRKNGLRHFLCHPARKENELCTDRGSVNATF